MEKSGLEAQVSSKTTCVKVSVITVIHNIILSGREATLRQCIESVHGQSYPNIEHIIIDGGSLDGTVAILDEYT